MSAQQLRSFASFAPRYVFVETSDQGAFPISIPAGAPGRATVAFTAFVEENHLWQIQQFGGRLVFDNSQLSINAGFLRLLAPLGRNVDSLDRALYVPLSFTPAFFSAGALQSTFAPLLQGNDIGPRVVMSVVLDVNNSDALTAHNVTDGAMAIGFRDVQLVTELAVVTLDPSRIDRGLDARLRNASG